MRPLSDLNRIAKSRQIDKEIEQFLANGGKIKKINSHQKLVNEAVDLLVKNKRKIANHLLNTLTKSVAMSDIKQELQNRGYKLEKMQTYSKLVPHFTIRAKK